MSESVHDNTPTDRQIVVQQNGDTAEYTTFAILQRSHILPEQGHMSRHSFEQAIFILVSSLQKQICSAGVSVSLDIAEGGIPEASF